MEILSHLLSYPMYFSWREDLPCSVWPSAVGEEKFVCVFLVAKIPFRGGGEGSTRPKKKKAKKNQDSCSVDQVKRLDVYSKPEKREKESERGSRFSKSYIDHLSPLLRCTLAFPSRFFKSKVR